MSKKLIYVCSFVLLILLMGLFVLERKQASDYTADYNKRWKNENELDIEEELVDTDEVNAGNEAEGKRLFESLKTSSRKALPGIVCWGDESMVGNGKSSLPRKLAFRLNEDLFASVKKDLSGLSGTLQLDELDLPVANMGVAGEGIREIMVRTGVKKMIVGEDYTISAGMDKKPISICDEDGQALRFAKKYLDRFGQVTIKGIEGHFQEGDVSYDALHSNVAYARAKKGKEVMVEEGTDIKIESASSYKKYIPVFFFQEKKEISTGDLIRAIRGTVRSDDVKGYAVLAAAGEGSELDKELKESFGDHYIRVDQSLETMTEKDYTLLADQVYENLKGQGILDKVAKTAADTKVEAEQAMKVEEEQ